MRNLSGKTGWMAIKVNLEKAYDRLRWDFIRDTLIQANFPPDMVNLIIQCITSTRMRVLWNGDTSDEFIPSRGIRQGDPLSPYIFMLCMERLAHIIKDSVSNNQ